MWFMEITLVASFLFSPLLTFPKVEKYFAETLGERRYEKIKKKYGIKLANTNYIREKDLLKIVLAAKEPNRMDLQSILDGAQTLLISDELREALLPYRVVEDLPAALFHKLYTSLATVPSGDYTINASIETLENKLLRIAHYWSEFFYYDPIWALGERERTANLNADMTTAQFYERLSGFYCSLEDLEVGQYIRAPDANGEPRYLRVVGRLVTGEGQKTFLFRNATTTMPSLLIRSAAGTPEKPSGLDAISHYIADLEKHIGRSGYESGLKYDEEMHAMIDQPVIELGYSIGGVYAQYRVAQCAEQIKELWTFKSPGVPERVRQEFQDWTAKIEGLPIHVYIAKGDIVDLTGGSHLGSTSSDNVVVHITQMEIPKLYAHRYNPDKLDQVKLEKISSGPHALIETPLHTNLETARQKCGQYFVVPVLKTVKKVSRKFSEGRLKKIRGFCYEVLTEDSYEIQHVQKG